MVLTFQIDRTSHIKVDSDLYLLFGVVLLIFGLYFFGTQIQVSLAKFKTYLAKKIGVFSVTKEYQLQRYVYQHYNSPISKLYRWVNEQLVAIGLKRQGVTPFGYCMFWAVCAVIISLIAGFVFNLGTGLTGMLWVVVFICMLVMTRVFVSERMEKRESDVMNAIDLIVPEIGKGVENAIITYKDNFAPAIRDDFSAFIMNIQDRGYSFNDAMMLLTDNLGRVFTEFAQKAIQYEASGDSEMLDIFTQIVETNRLRRELRDDNTIVFAELKQSFFITTGMTVGYFFFMCVTDAFTRYFFLTTTPGKFLLIIIILIIFLETAYISTIKSRAI